jgi:nucleotide-binding universal stress UspA family protein
MTCSSVLVHSRLNGSFEPIEVAVHLGRYLGAHVVGLCGLRDIAVLKSFYRRERGFLAEAISARLSEKFVSDCYQQASSIETKFIDAARRAGVSHEWLVGEGDAADLLRVLGGLQDLIIVGQTAPVAESGWDVAEQLVLMPGQTTIVVPHTGRFPVVGRRVVIAWNGSHEAARAIRGAAPFLQRAEEVTLLLGRMREPPLGVTRMPEINIRDWVQRISKKVTAVKFDVADHEAGEQILAYADRVQADLLVMGAFGRSWLRERILGGATRHVLSHMAVPVLMAH